MPVDWLMPHETAKTMLARVLALRSRPLTSVAPLHRVPLHAGHVLEVVGPSGSAKSELLLQVAVTCILPKEWDGVLYGGSEGVVMMFDLDCRFDMLRLVHVLQLRINEARGFMGMQPKQDLAAERDGVIAQTGGTPNAAQRLSQQEDTLFLDCLRRFLYTRCYNSFDFLAALKTVHAKLKRVAEDGMNVQLVMIDSIGAFYWLDRSFTSTSQCSSLRRTALSLQVVCEAVVQELHQLLKTHPVLILATKTLISTLVPRDRTCMDKFEESVDQNQKGSLGRKSLKNKKILHREFMPAVWQAFVSHRIMLQGPFQPDSMERSHGGCGEKLPFFTAEWETSVRQVDKFLVQDNGIKLSR